MNSDISGDSAAFNLDHLGIISAVFKDLGLVEKLNQRLPRFDIRRIVSNGHAILAMVLNGLGFSNRRLYLMPQFLENKPVDLLISPNLKPKHFDDHVLGRALDEISEYGASKLFVEIAFDVALEQRLLGKSAHIDTTSFSFEGNYAEDPNGGEAVSICHGFSKDHRPDLKQVVLNMAVSGPANMPIFMEPKDGNSSDKQTLYNGIETVRRFQNQLSEGFKDFLWIADSALYTKDRLLACNDFFWISRVPETITEAKAMVRLNDKDLNWIAASEGYRYVARTSNYGGIEQRWILVFSEQAYKREKLTFESNLKKQKEKLEKDVSKLRNEIFGCKDDAKRALEKVMIRFPFYKAASFEAKPVEKHTGSGRPKKDATKTIKGYQLEIEISANDEKVQTELSTKGRFILATNQLAIENSAEILESYKQQQNVEQGFRFLKDPWFMADTMFLKSPRRIEALMMVMTLCLMIYNISQHRMRVALEEQNETIPNQLGKQTSTPTLRWAFQLMEGVIVARELLQTHETRTTYFNLNALRVKIVRLFGPLACEIYGSA